MPRRLRRARPWATRERRGAVERDRHDPPAAPGVSESMAPSVGGRCRAGELDVCEHAIDADRAFPDAAGALTANGRKLVDVAQAVVDSQLLLLTPPPPEARPEPVAVEPPRGVLGSKAWLEPLRWSAPFQSNSGRRRASPRGRHVATSVGANGGEECVESCGRDTDRGVGRSVVELDLPRLRVVYESAREHGVGYVALAFVRGGRS